MDKMNEDDGSKRGVGRPKKKLGRPKKQVVREVSSSSNVDQLEVSLTSNTDGEEASFTMDTEEQDVSCTSNTDEQEASLSSNMVEEEASCSIIKEEQEVISSQKMDEQEVSNLEEKENEAVQDNMVTISSKEDDASPVRPKRKSARPKKEVVTPKEKVTGPRKIVTPKEKVEGPRKVGRPKKKVVQEGQCSSVAAVQEAGSSSIMKEEQLISRGRNMFTRNRLLEQRAIWRRNTSQSRYFGDPHLKMMEGQRVKVTEVNPYLVCVLCQGYLIDATTIVECLHSFCRSCIFRHLDKELLCPKCKTPIPNTKLHRHIRPDKTLQDIVYKCVPGLFHREMQRRKDFYKDHPHRDEHLGPECRGVSNDRLILSPIDGVSLSIESYDDEREKEEWSNNDSPTKPQFGPSGPKRFLQCPAGFKIAHLKKFLRQKYGLSDICKIDILYRRECIPDSYSLMDIAYIYTWKRNKPMRFYFRMPEILMKQLLSAFVSHQPAAKEIKEKEESQTALTTTVKSVEKKSDENKEEEKNENVEGVPMEATPNVNYATDKAEKQTTLLQITQEKTDEAEQKAVHDNEKQNPDDSKMKTDDTEEKTCELKQKMEDAKPKSEDGTENGILTPRPLSKQDELSVSVLLSLGQLCVEKKEDHKFLVPQPMTPKNDISEKRTKGGPRPSVNKIASDLAETKALLTKLQGPTSPIALINCTPTAQNQHISISPQRLQPLRLPQPQQQKKLQPVQKQQQNHKQQIGKNHYIFQQKQQHGLQQNHQMQHLMQHKQIQQLQQQHIHQQLHQQQPYHQLHFQHLQQFHQLQAQQPLILQIQQQPQAVQQIKETAEPVTEEHKHVVAPNQNIQIMKAPQTPPMSKSPQPNTQKTVQNEPTQKIVQHLQPPQQQQKQPQKQQQQQIQQQQIHQQQQHQIQQQQLQKQLQQQQIQQQQQQQQIQQQHQKQQQQLQIQQQQQQKIQQQRKIQQQQTQKPQQPLQQKNQPQSQKTRLETTVAEKTPLNGNTSVQSPQVTLNTSNGSVTIMAQLKTPTIAASSTVGAPASNPSSPLPTVNGTTPDTPRPQGVHQNLPRTVLPQAPFVNGKTVPKPIQQKNLSGQRLNTNVPEAKNGLIQQSNANNRLPTFQKNTRKVGSPVGVNKNGQTLDERIQKLYNGPTNKPPSPGGRSESRLASWLNNKFPSPNKEEAEMVPSLAPKTPKEATMQRYKRKLQEMQKVQEICEITQENPRPDDAKRRREVTPDVSIELMRAADMKKLDPVAAKRGEKRPMPGLKSLQEVSAKRKKEEDSALDLRKPGDVVVPPALPWLTPRPPPHFIPRPT